MGWLPVGDSYEISLVDGKVAARTSGPRSTGRPLKTLPKVLRDSAEVDRLRQLAQWLDRHAAECLARVDAWVVSSLPVPTGLLARVWPDPAWRDALRDLVVLGDDPAEAGFLRDVTDTGDLRVVNLDGETVRLSPASATLPHPVRLPDLADLREFADEIDVTQRIEQLHRGTWGRPADLRDRDTTITDFRGTRVPNRLAARAATLGFRVSGSRVACRVWEGGRTVEAAIWFDEDYWDSEATLGTLSWSVVDGPTLRLTEVGPVAWSEGMRMATALSGAVTGTGTKA
ncbi:DUF4132 domain-containing protein [Micromonospora sagamiensis]|uniref:Uncharacterized protein DUF4132 n=1 Tax=Micromonospora sagamiensis TaxID=47875 RepID=A0A562WGQ0_9ACTN|nr:DUF4132 domain-containing protein [Micromonospora sagamiensis]TWJ28744.1 uncharacterized protein DUF4132 [Micromonospora sagamiensis]BCL12349.1 hypothetical protein GCM10017556_00880 [Micromonospora sagamiensis]